VVWQSLVGHTDEAILNSPVSCVTIFLLLEKNEWLVGSLGNMEESLCIGVSHPYFRELKEKE
jgi:hypothetical protein